MLTGSVLSGFENAPSQGVPASGVPGMGIEASMHLDAQQG